MNTNTLTKEQQAKLDVQTYITKFGTGYRNNDDKGQFKSLVLKESVKVDNVKTDSKGRKEGDFHAIADDSVIFSQSIADDLLEKADMFGTYAIKCQVEGSKYDTNVVNQLTGEETKVPKESPYSAIKLVKRSAKLVSSDSELMF